MYIIFSSIEYNTNYLDRKQFKITCSHDPITFILFYPLDTTYYYQKIHLLENSIFSFFFHVTWFESNERTNVINRKRNWDTTCYHILSIRLWNHKGSLGISIHSSNKKFLIGIFYSKVYFFNNFMVVFMHRRWQ